MAAEDARTAVHEPTTKRGSPLLLWVAVAAAIAVVAALAAANQGPRWRLDGASGTGVVIAEGRSIPMEETRELERALQPGNRIRLPAGARLDLSLPHLYRLQLTQGAEILIPSAPGRWFWRVSRSTLFTGVARFATGPGFRGARLVVETPQGAVEASSSAFAVIQDFSSSEICVLEGDVVSAPRGGPAIEIGAGTCHSSFADGRPSRSGRIPDTEETRLVLLRERARRL